MFSFCPHGSAPGLNHYLRSGSTAKPLTRQWLGLQSGVATGWGEQLSRAPPGTTSGGGTFQKSGFQAGSVAQGPALLLLLLAAVWNGANPQLRGLALWEKHIPSQAKGARPVGVPQRDSPTREATSQAVRRWGDGRSGSRVAFSCHLHFLRWCLPHFADEMDFLSGWRGSDHGC